MRHVYGWLLLTPAAILLVAFTHYRRGDAHRQPVLHRDGRAAVPVRRAGKLRVPGGRPDLLAGAQEQPLFAFGTIPTAIALAMVMALLGQRPAAGRALVRMAYFTPTVLPMIAVANIWLFFYTADRPARPVGRAVRHPSRNWLGDPDTVLASTMIMSSGRRRASS